MVSLLEAYIWPSRTERQVRRGEKFTGEDSNSRIPPSSPRHLGVSILTVHHFPCEYLGEVKRQRCSVCGMHSSLSGFEDSYAHVHIGDNRVNRGGVGLYPEPSRGRLHLKSLKSLSVRDEQSGLTFRLPQFYASCFPKTRNGSPLPPIGRR